MIIKLTEDHDLFSWLETKEEHEWFDNNSKGLPLGMLLISTNHVNNYADDWYKENIGGQLWYHLKK